MSTLDIILSVCYALFIIGGLRKGLILQVTAVAALVVASWAAYMFAGQAAQWFSTHTSAGQISTVASYIAVFVLSALACHLLGNLLSKSVKMVALGWLDRLGGMLLSVVTCTIVLGFVFSVLNMLNGVMPLLPGDALENSVIYPKIDQAWDLLYPKLKELFENARDVKDTVA
ncbi:MAG: CvpA family protein [Bacteroidales bacterium]|nr:CvpA family protein [Bacteroidales bacterium]